MTDLRSGPIRPEDAGTLSARLRDALSDQSFLRLRLKHREAELIAEAAGRASCEDALRAAEQDKQRLLAELSEAGAGLGHARKLLDERELDITKLRQELVDQRRAAHDARVAIRTATLRVQALERALRGTLGALSRISTHLDRVEESRSWRFGHGVFRFLRVITFRRSMGEGAVAAAQLEVSRARASLEEERK